MTHLASARAALRLGVGAIAGVAIAIAAAGCASVDPRDARTSISAATSAATSNVGPLEAAPCPAGVPSGTRCLAGRDAAGAYVLIAVPRDWNRILVVHAHGGPELGAPEAQRNQEDLKRWSIMVKAGYAWVATTYAQGGVAVRAAADDIERARAIFVASVGTPRLTVLHGQSWGASVAARAAERHPKSFDALLLTSGVLGGGGRSYAFRLDLRVVYQAVCANHPLASEPQYPLWQGLPEGAKLTRAELADRVDACTGVRKPRAERSAEQQRRLDAILGVVQIPERSLISHLAWGTWHFQDIVFRRLDGQNPFSNDTVRYRGSGDDAALDAKVARYRADATAARRFAEDTDPTGAIDVPVLTAHAIDDPTAFVELESVFRETMTRAGRADRLVQTFTHEREHSYLSDPEYVALMDALLAWVEQGRKPTQRSIAERCVALESRYGRGCYFAEDYSPGALSDRVPER